MAAFRVFQKKQIRVDLMSMRQERMFKIGNVGVAAVKNRVVAAQGPNDTPAKPLSKQYAIKKTKRGLGNRRNLTYTGDMLRNFMVRTVTEGVAKARVAGGRKSSVKAWINNKLEEWCVFSPKNKEAVRRAAQQVVNEQTPRMVIQKGLGGNN